MIAIAGKSVEGLSWLKAQRMKRCVPPRALSPSALLLTRARAPAASRPNRGCASSGW